ncbi:Gfo/Idh/MocA family protein [Thermotoga caldifontis]|uniref:Gfo/Idh/MocA family protein n=1 Tax=Thermotoga caldifontis TaxID=1508419 RepID=UPI000597A50C|nr:Gfo/Idh/MocA family oxidoreductase [Thermotoga caldifontis]
MKLRMALVGCGRISSKHVEAIERNRHLLEPVAVCDIVEERAQRTADILEQKLGVKPEVYTNYVDVLRRSDVDFVSIATPSGLHHEMTMQAMEFGKHVLVEKPLALDTKHLREIVDTSKRKKLKVGVCHQNRFNPPVQELRKKIESGAFGKLFHGVVSVRWNRNESYYRQDAWRGTWEQDGGVLMNQSIHGIDLLQWMLGEKPKRVFGLIKNLNHPYIPVEDLAAGIVEFESGCVGIVEATSNVFDRNLEEVLTIFGERGTVKIGGLAVNRILVWRFPNEDSHPFMSLPDPETVYGHGHGPLYEDFCKAIVEDREPYIDAESGSKAVQIVLAIYKSSLENRWVEFPFDFSTTEMKEWRG